MKPNEIAEIEKIIGYKFNNSSLLVQAFSRGSYINEKKQASRVRGKDVLEAQDYQTLEFLGDGVLGLAVSSSLFKSHVSIGENGAHSSFTEGEYSAIKSNLSDKKMLSSLTRRLGLENYLLLGVGDIKEQVAKRSLSVCEDLFESIIGAVYVDSSYNFDTAKQVVYNTLDIDEYLEKLKDTENSKDSKTKLQELIQKKYKNTKKIEYVNKGETGPDHDKTFLVCVKIDEKEYPTCKGKNKQTAEKLAAEKALIELKK